MAKYALHLKNEIIATADAYTEEDARRRFKKILKLQRLPKFSRVLCVQEEETEQVQS